MSTMYIFLKFCQHHDAFIASLITHHIRFDFEDRNMEFVSMIVMTQGWNLYISNFSVDFFCSGIIFHLFNINKIDEHGLGTI